MGKLSQQLKILNITVHNTQYAFHYICLQLLDSLVSGVSQGQYTLGIIYIIQVEILLFFLLSEMILSHSNFYFKGIYLP